MHCEPKFYKVKLLGKLIVQHGVKALFDGRSSVQTSSLHVYFSNLLSSHVSPKTEATHEGGC